MPVLDVSFLIPREQVDEILEKSDIVSVISEYVKLEKKGNSYKGLCPFHKEKTPSFSVLEDRQIFKCFGCGKGGNVAHFIMLAEGLAYWDAIAFLAEKQGIRIVPSGDRRAEEQSALRKKIAEINKEAARFFYHQLAKSREGYTYFTGRGIPPETVKHFGLGYAGPEWDSLLKFFLSKGVREKELLTAGLVVPNKRGGYCDKFRNKVMFPIFDVLGNVVAFGGRVLDDSKPKYINSPETPLYTKGKHLYGLNFARQSGSRRVIIVEGYMDCIALHQRGITWAVAALGTALTNDQARLLKKYFDEVITCFDADAAGQSATLRGLDILASKGFKVRVMAVPDGKDPDEFLRKHSPDEFISVADRAKTLVEYKLSLVEAKFPPRDNASRVRFLNGVTEVLAAIEDPLERDLYINWVSREYEISTEPLKEQIAVFRAGGQLNAQNIFMKRPVAAKRTPTGNGDTRENLLSDREKKIDLSEKTLLLLAAEDAFCLRALQRDVKEDFFVIGSNKELYSSLLAREKAGQPVGKEFLLADADLESAETLSRLLAGWITPSDINGAYRELLKKLQRLKNEGRLAEIYARLAESDLDEETKNALRKELNTILAEKRIK